MNVVFYLSFLSSHLQSIPEVIATDMFARCFISITILDYIALGVRDGLARIIDALGCAGCRADDHFVDIDIIRLRHGI